MTIEALLLKGGSKSQVLIEQELNIILAYVVGDNEYSFNKAIHTSREYTKFHSVVASLLETKSESQTHSLYLISMILKHKM